MKDSSTAYAVPPSLIPVNSRENVSSGVRIITEEMQYEKCLSASMALSTELRSVWGKDAFDARFDDRCLSTPRLIELHKAYCSEKDLYLKVLDSSRKPLPRSKNRFGFATRTFPARKAA